METKVLVIGIIKKEKKVLLRNKPAGSLPYKESWYLFGGELSPDNASPEDVISNKVKEQTGINIRAVEKLSWDIEIKPDLKGKETFYIYLDYLCEYIEGELKAGEGIEKLEWVPIEKLSEYDLVPPSVELFKKIGYLR